MHFHVELAGLDLGKIEDVVDDGQQALTAVANRARDLALVVVELRIQQHAAHPDHAIHRRADLVAHRRQEAALRFVGGLGGGARLLGLVEKPRILNGNHGLVGEGAEQRRGIAFFG